MYRWTALNRDKDENAEDNLILFFSYAFSVVQRQLHHRLFIPQLFEALYDTSLPFSRVGKTTARWLLDGSEMRLLFAYALDGELIVITH